MPRARRTVFLALAMLLASRSFGQEPASNSPPNPQPVVASTATNSNDSPQAVLSVDADATAVSEADSVAEYGTVEEFPSRSFFGEALVGYYRSSFIGPSIPRFDYVPIAFRVGYRPWEDRGYIASRMSVMLEATADPITKSFGNYLTGASLMLRYDACPSWTICPYFQVGTGFVLTDAWRDQKQMAIGEEFEFLQQVEFGVRWKLRECLSVEAEYGLQHTSNAGFARRNGGANDLGVSIGLRWTFGGR